ncbi:unnamed protein product [Prorocentrum cordatum]|uniref:Uncharacterized protein n=1 Tax=Prorocentrum cordatum TaxID=2364126 RepID=A0ABN9TWE0_9DINO|nr:unnamed protein product [Polarella glacialis]
MTFEDYYQAMGTQRDMLRTPAREAAIETEKVAIRNQLSAGVEKAIRFRSRAMPRSTSAKCDDTIQHNQMAVYGLCKQQERIAMSPTRIAASRSPNADEEIECTHAAEFRQQPDENSKAIEHYRGDEPMGVAEDVRLVGFDEALSADRGTGGDAQMAPAEPKPPQEAPAEMPEEPPAGAEHLKVSFRLPTGKRETRRFLPADPVERMVSAAPPPAGGVAATRSATGGGGPARAHCIRMPAVAVESRDAGLGPEREANPAKIAPGAAPARSRGRPPRQCNGRGSRPGRAGRGRRRDAPRQRGDPPDPQHARRRPGPAGRRRSARAARRRGSGRAPGPASSREEASQDARRWHQPASLPTKAAGSGAATAEAKFLALLAAANIKVDPAEARAGCAAAGDRRRSKSTHLTPRQRSSRPAARGRAFSAWSGPEAVAERLPLAAGR